MSRRYALLAAILAVVAFGVLYFWPEEAGAGDTSVGVSGRLHLGDRTVLRSTLGDGIRFRRDGDRDGRHRDGRHRGDRHRRPLIVLPFPYRERVIVEERIVVQPSPPPAPPAAAPPPEPLDPTGQARMLSPTGAAAPREWVLGGWLPPELPHVTLDPAAYGLPEPPPGQIYARVEGDVLRIEAGTRRIVSVVAR